MSLSVRRPPRSQTLPTSSNGEQYHHTHGTTKQPVQFQTNKAEKDRGWGRGNPEDSVDCCWSPTVDTYQTVKEMPECDTPLWVGFLWSQLILILMCDWFKSWCVRRVSWGEGKKCEKKWFYFGKQEKGTPFIHSNDVQAAHIKMFFFLEKPWRHFTLHSDVRANWRGSATHVTTQWRHIAGRTLWISLNLTFL